MSRPKGSKNGGGDSAPDSKPLAVDGLDYDQLIKDAHIPKGTKEVLITDDGQVFTKLGAGYTHARYKGIKFKTIEL